MLLDFLALCGWMLAAFCGTVALFLIEELASGFRVLMKLREKRLKR